MAVEAGWKNYIAAAALVVVCRDLQGVVEDGEMGSTSCRLMLESTLLLQYC